MFRYSATSPYEPVRRIKFPKEPPRSGIPVPHFVTSPRVRERKRQRSAMSMIRLEEERTKEPRSKTATIPPSQTVSMSVRDYRRGGTLTRASFGECKCSPVLVLRSVGRALCRTPALTLVATFQTANSNNATPLAGVSRQDVPIREPVSPTRRVAARLGNLS